jgi:hypothetical protein
MNCENIETLIIKTKGSELSQMVQKHIEHCEKCKQFYADKVLADQSFVELQNCPLGLDLTKELNLRVKKIVKEESDSKVLSTKYDFLLKPGPKRSALIYGLASLLLISLVAFFVSYVHSSNNIPMTEVAGATLYKVNIQNRPESFTPKSFVVFNKDEGNFSKNLQAEISFGNGKVNIHPEDALIQFFENQIELQSGKITIDVKKIDFGLKLGSYFLLLNGQKIQVNKTREKSILVFLEGDPLYFESEKIKIVLDNQNSEVVLHHE